MLEAMLLPFTPAQLGAASADPLTPAPELSPMVIGAAALAEAVLDCVDAVVVKGEVEVVPRLCDCKRWAVWGRPAGGGRLLPSKLPKLAVWVANGVAAVEDEGQKG